MDYDKKIYVMKSINATFSIKDEREKERMRKKGKNSFMQLVL